MTFESLADVFQEGSDAELGVVLNIDHVEVNDVFAVFFNEGRDEIDAFHVT